MRIRVIVAAHKPYPMPGDGMYLPLQVGSAGKESIGFTRDDTGENISQKNPTYCELTGLYWAWKNLDADAIGLVHYRRLLGKKKGKDPLAGVLTGKEAAALLERAPCILPKKRNYYIESLYDHYAHTLRVLPLELTGEIIKEEYPAYYPEFCALKKRRSAHMFNMGVFRREVLDEYCSFLFSVLGKLEERVPQSEYDDAFHARFFGRISELLLDVFLRTNNIAYIEVGLIYPEGENLAKKAAAMLRSKFSGKKYGKSF